MWWEARYGHCGRDMTDVVIRSESCVSLLSSCFLMTFFPLMISYPFPKKIQGGMQTQVPGFDLNGGFNISDICVP